jgi:hypothetical protein
MTNADLAIYQGDDYAATITVRNADNTPADISNYTAQSQIRRAVADEDPVVVVNITTTIISPFVVLSIPHAQTALLTGRYVWDLQLTSNTDAITTIVSGKVIAQPQVTTGP